MRNLGIWALYCLLPIAFAWAGIVHAADGVPAVSDISVHDFDAETWQQLLKSGPRPAAYMFTTSYCSTCVEAFSSLRNSKQLKGRKVEFGLVMMDVDGVAAQRHASQFAGVNHLFAFSGFEAAIRYAIDPHWPNVTPYVVLIDAAGKAEHAIGPPPPDMVRRWLR